MGNFLFRSFFQGVSSGRELTHFRVDSGIAEPEASPIHVHDISTLPFVQTMQCLNRQLLLDVSASNMAALKPETVRRLADSEFKTV